MPPKNRRRSSGKVKKNTIPCTYALGYVRQDLYACRKCSAKANGRQFAFCAGCRATCHADCAEHVFELYTKRAFRCDCGNKRARNTCLLNPDKDDVNIGNEGTYSHNFEGRYCRCDTEYVPDKNMVQCVMCEDWFHETCYRTDAQARGVSAARALSVEYELICKDCVKRLPVLMEYYNTLHAWSKPADVKKWRMTRLKRGCTRPRITMQLKAGAIDLLWKPGFRINLCRCADCSDLYRAASALYITDRSDFLNAVEEDMEDVFTNETDEDVVDQDDEGNLRIESSGGKKRHLSNGNRDAIELKVPKSSKGTVSWDRSKSVFDSERIPRKPVEDDEDNAGAGRTSDSMGEAPSSLPEKEVKRIRERIFQYLSESIDKNSGRLDESQVLMFVSDLKADILATYDEKLGRTYGKGAIP